MTGANGRPIRVLHVINGRFFGGGHKSTLLLIRALGADATISATLCTLGEGGGLPLGELSPTVIPFNGRYNDPFVLFRTALRLRSLIAAKNVDIVHTHGLDADLIGALAVLGSRCRHFSHLRITPPRSRRESPKAEIRRFLFRLLTESNRSCFIAVSEAVRQEMSRYYRIALDRITTVRNGVDTREFYPVGIPDEAFKRAADRRFVIGTAGRLAPMKGFEFLLKAVHWVKESGIDTELRIAGSGSGETQLSDLVRVLGLERNVRFVGQVDAMREFYSALDVFVLPSVSTEGLPLVILEAMATGVPVIATAIAGAPEVIRDGVDGMLVPPGSVEGLAGALSVLAIDIDARIRIGTSGADRVRAAFTVSRVADEVAATYRRAIPSS